MHLLYYLRCCATTEKINLLTDWLIDRLSNLNLLTYASLVVGSTKLQAFPDVKYTLLIDAVFPFEASTVVELMRSVYILPVIVIFSSGFVTVVLKN